ncbi:MAG: TIGR03617 family F420-dependent LLM class oxidoreductase [Candidatus Eremiobacteraeota bacterium]|nr:TIGR03617 family F420-dependent LLM class oxidoreductase [Candidatus Eremiobacteraeota bacterium]
MKLDVVYSGNLQGVDSAARKAEQLRFSGLWVTETSHNPFFHLLRAAEASPNLTLGTAVAIALARSPFTLAQTAWDLAEFSQGRFWLGLGSQVRAHIVKRFSMPWDKPVAQMREMILALRAIWEAFQTGNKLNFEGEYYRHTLLTPFFNPGPIEHPDIPIGLAAVGEKMTALAAELANFVVLHPFTNVEYLDKVTMPAVEAGLKKADRPRPDFTVLGSLFAITGDEQQQAMLDKLVRRQISFYGSTPAYRGVLEAIGQDELAEELHKLSRQGEWKTMAGLIDDDLVDRFAVRGAPDKLPGLVAERFGGMYDRVILSVPLVDH